MEYEAGILADYVPYTSRTEGIMERLAELEPRTLAAMHGACLPWPRSVTLPSESVAIHAGSGG